jgi:raffinose/stachyose/melibiose transport system permease protein
MVGQSRLFDLARRFALLAFATVAVGLPMWLVLVNSMKPGGEANELGLGLPQAWAAVENYSTVIEEGRVLTGLRNTLLVAVPTIVIVVILGGLASWTIARSRSRAASLLYYLSISGVLIPPAVISSIAVLRALGVHGTHAGLILFYAGVFMAFAVFLVTGFVRTIPFELEEAARIDGAGSLRIFFTVILPLLAPITVTASFILLLFVWNDFWYSFFMMSGRDNRTLILGLFNFVSGYQYQIRWNLVFANVIVVSIPLAVVFMLAQRRIVAGLLGTGADK